MPMGEWRSDQQHVYRQRMQRIHALAHYLQQGGSLSWGEDPPQGAYGFDDPTRTITIRIDGQRFDAVYAELRSLKNWG